MRRQNAFTRRPAPCGVGALRWHMSLFDYNSTTSVRTCRCPGSRVINLCRQLSRQVASVFKEKTHILRQCNIVTLLFDFRALCVCLHIRHRYIQICIHRYRCVYTYMYICTYICMCIHIQVYTYVYMHICVHIFANEYMHIHISCIFLLATSLGENVFLVSVITYLLRIERFGWLLLAQSYFSHCSLLSDLKEINIRWYSLFQSLRKTQ